MGRSLLAFIHSSLVVLFHRELALLSLLRFDLPLLVMAQRSNASQSYFSDDTHKKMFAPSSLLFRFVLCH